MFLKSSRTFIERTTLAMVVKSFESKEQAAVVWSSAEYGVHLGLWYWVFRASMLFMFFFLK